MRLAVLVGAKGRGSNLQAIIEAVLSGHIDGEISIVIGSHRDAPALQIAAEAGVETVVVGTLNRTDEAYGALLQSTIEKFGADLVVLAGYMRKLPDAVTRAFSGRVINIHPSLLPHFSGQGMYGRRVHEAVLAAGVDQTGCTVHVVDGEYDHGAVIAQKHVCVRQGDTVDTLASRVLAAEHALLVEVITDVCNRKIPLPIV